MKFWQKQSISRGTLKGHAAPKEDMRTPLCLLYGIDCSGSMGEETRIVNENGESVFVPKIQQANEGFAMCAKSINRFAKENTRFLPKWQVIELNTYCKPIFQSFVTVHDHSLSESQFAAGGSTNIEAWINNILQFLTKKHLGNYNRAVNIILLSDGVPTDIDGWALSTEAYTKIVDKFKAYLDEHDLSRNVEFYFIAVGDDAEPFGRYFAGDDHFFKVEDCESIADKLDLVARQTLADSTTVATNPIDFSNDDEEDEDDEDELVETDSDFGEDEDIDSEEDDEVDADSDDDADMDEEFDEEDEEDEDDESDDSADDDDDGEGDGSLDDILKF